MIAIRDVRRVLWRTSSMTSSAISSRRSSQVPSARVYGKYWVKIEIVCLPSRRHRVVDRRLHVDVHERFARRVARAGLVAGSLHVVDRWGDEEPAGAALTLIVAFEGGEPRQLASRPC